ncbi:type II secretion system F family protein [Hydrogenophaga sp. SNF1]|uniref:type II secretion system F family protein n=1 Tax=Hydrogenophaga sp. SNF1 TaxID=3098762 RepID=UPI002ACBE2EE|nr:type II secretion system F family protein [Hydrogenophaga sp. SNF1]WQB82443.1 type II secretion system F family protein [Hydrogenophaga sp. SNF1]
MQTPFLMQHPGLVLTLLALGFMVPVALLAWLLGRAVAQVPEEDRQYKDAPPLGFRLAWWPIQWISHYLEPLLPVSTREALARRLRKGGLDYTLAPAQFVASRGVCALLSAALAAWGANALAPTHAGAWLQVLPLAALMGWAYPALWLGDRLKARQKELLRTLPFFLDVITLCVEAGLNLQGAMTQAVAKGPVGVLRDELQRVLRDIRAGKARAEALRAMAQRLDEPAVGHWVVSVIQAESMGMSLGPVLRVQADQRRSERFLRAEKLAMEAPVKMLFPLLAFIFPCTFIVLFFPIAMKFMHSGL